MGVKHAAPKVSGERGYAAEWNADHVVDSDVAFNHYELLEAAIENVAAFPGGPVAGQLLFRSDISVAYVWNGTAWDPISPARRAATLIVAASNSLDKYRADYICDGTDDYVEIQDALDALPVGGGKVLLLDGTYNLYAVEGVGDLIVARNGTCIEGQGASTVLTNVTTGASSAIFTVSTKNKVSIRNLRIDSNEPDDFWAVVADHSDDLLVQNVHITGSVAYLEIYDSSRAHVLDVVATNANFIFYLYRCYRCNLSNLSADNSSSSWVTFDEGGHNVASSCISLVSQIYIDENYSVVQGCTAYVIFVAAPWNNGNVLHGNFTDEPIIDGGTNTHLADNWTF